MDAEEMFGSDNISEIDLSELTLAVKKIVAAYDKPITDYDAEMARQKFDNVPIEKIVSLTKAITILLPFARTAVFCESLVS